MRRSKISFMLAVGTLNAASWLAAPGASAQAGPLRSRTPSASPADVALAETYAADAFDAFGRKAYAEALALYERALEAAPSADIVYNIARVYDLGLADRSRALDYYQRYAADPGAVPSRVEVANQRSSELRAAERAAAEAAELDAIARDFPLLDSSEDSSPTLGAEGRSFSVLEVAVLSAGGAGLVGLGVGIGFGLSARALTDEWRRDCDGDACASQRGVDAAESAARKARVATLGFAAGGSLLALGTVLWLVDLGNERPDSAAGLQLMPLASGADLGGSISGRF